MSLSNVEIVREFVHALDRGDDAGALSRAQEGLAFAPYLPQQKTYRGAEGLREYRHDLDEAFGDWRFEHHDFLPGRRDLVLQLYKLVVRGQPTGTTAHWDGAVLWTVSGGKVAGGIGIPDQADAREIAGVPK